MFSQQILSQRPLSDFRSHVLRHDPLKLNTGWEEVLMPQGALIAGLAFKDQELLAFAQRYAEFHSAVAARFDEKRLDRELPEQGIVLGTYCGNWGMPFVLAPLATGPNRSHYEALIRQICDFILSGSVRLKDGVISHGGWDYALRTVWVDTMYYTSSPLSYAYRLLGEQRYGEEAISQCLLHAELLQDPATGCFFHDADPATMLRTNWFWSRGNGWVILAIADTLRNCKGVPGWDRLLAVYRALATGLLRLQHPCGMWRIVPENEAAHLETSGTAMICAGLTIGVAEGWLEGYTASNLRRGFVELLEWITPWGALYGAQRPAGLGGWETHKQSVLAECPYATGMFLRLLGEMKTAELL